MKIGNLTVNNTRGLVSPATRICGMIYSPAKFGKTELASSLNDITQKYRGKPTLFIACEAAEGGGTMTVSAKGIDYVMPSSWSDMEQLLSNLACDETYGGVILDNATDWVFRIIKPHALKFPTKEKLLGARQEGVPVRSDYQVMGECARQQLNKLVNLTNENTSERFRKDLIVTALERERTDESGVLTAITPDLPGALSGVATALFQSVMSIRIKQRTVPDPVKPGSTKRVMQRYLHVAADGLRVTDDRVKMFPHEYSLTSDEGKPIGLLPLYEAWLAQFKKETSSAS